MTVFHISCPQYRINEDGSTKEVGVYFQALVYVRPTSIEVAMHDFLQTHALSTYASDGWMLGGNPAYMIIKPEIYKGYESFIDDGVSEPNIEKPKPAKFHLKVIK